MRKLLQEFNKHRNDIVDTIQRVVERHEQDGPRYVYAPTVPREQAQEGAVRRLVTTFFGGSTTRAVAALLEGGASDLSRAELDELAGLIDEARRAGR